MGKPDFSSEATFALSNMDPDDDVQYVADMAKRMYDSGRESMRAERDEAVALLRKVISHLTTGTTAHGDVRAFLAKLEKP